MGESTIRVSLYTICLMGFALFVAGFISVFIGTAFDLSFSLQGFVVDEKVLFIAIVSLTFLILLVLFWQRLPSWPTVRAIGVTAAVLSAVSLVLLLTDVLRFVVLDILGVAVGLLAYIWLCTLSSVRPYLYRRGYSFLSRSQVITGVLLMALLTMVPLFSVIAIYISLLFSACLGLLALYATSAIASSSEAKESLEDADEPLPWTMSGKALAIVFGYAVLMGVSVGYSVRYTHVNLSALIFAVLLTIFGLCMYVLCERDLARRLMEESIRFFVGVAALVALSLSVFYGNWFCTVVVAMGSGLGFSSIFLRIGYYIKIATAGQRQHYRSTGIVLSAFFIGILVGAMLSFYFFENIDARMLGGIILVGLSISIGTVSIGRGGYNLQSESIREAEDYENLEAANKLLYEKVCRAISDEYGLTERQAEVFRYLGENKNARYIQEKLVISSHTAKSHIYAVFGKMDIHSQQELIAIVQERFEKEKRESR